MESMVYFDRKKLLFLVNGREQEIDTKQVTTKSSWAGRRSRIGQIVYRNMEEGHHKMKNSTERKSGHASGATADLGM